MDKERCAFDLDEKCSALLVKDCKGCTFYKTKEQLKAGREKATERLMTMDRNFLDYVKGKYYNQRRRKGDGSRES